jgi:hypothetical protein
VAQVNAIREAAQVAFEQKDVQLLQSILPKATTRQDQVPTYPHNMITPTFSSSFIFFIFIFMI